MSGSDDERISSVPIHDHGLATSADISTVAWQRIQQSVKFEDTAEAFTLTFILCNAQGHTDMVIMRNGRPTSIGPQYVPALMLIIDRILNKQLRDHMLVRDDYAIVHGDATWYLGRAILRHVSAAATWVLANATAENMPIASAIQFVSMNNQVRNNSEVCAVGYGQHDLRIFK